MRCRKESPTRIEATRASYRLSILKTDQLLLLHDLIEALLLPSESLTAFLLYSFDVPLDFLLRDLDKNTFEVVAVPSYPKLPQPC